MNLENIKKIHVIGIKGSGVIAVVEILYSLGIKISGSDTNEKFFTDEILKKMDIKYSEKFSPENIPTDIDLVIYSTAYNEKNNVEFAEAKRRNLKMISYPEILAELFNQKYGIAVCGTHGKTTTSAMLAHVLKALDTDPSAVIGSRVVGWEGNAISGKGEFFVAEADEFQNKLKLYNPKGAILTSVDFDHPDFFPNFEDYKKTFKDFVAQIPKGGFLVAWGDSVDTLEVTKEATCAILTYGFGEENDYIVASNNPGKFEVKFNGKNLGEFETKLIGRHNILNAVSVIAVCRKLNLDLEKIREALKNFQGTKRRFEYIGERNGAILIDDYGHHPQELQVTLKGAREIYPQKNIWAVFHPHSYSRTQVLLPEFAQSFSDADHVIVLDIYGSAREDSGRVSAKDLVREINKFDRDKAEHIATIDKVVEFLKDKIGRDDVVITIGAGNCWEIAEKLSVKD